MRASLHRSQCFTFLIATAVLGCDTTDTSTVESPDGTSIFFQSEGSGGPALLFVHGWGGDITYWAAQRSAFSESHQVVTVDLAGHGRSSASRQTWSVQRFAEDVAAVAEHLELSDVVLVGHSLGSPVATEAALLLGDRAVALIHVDAFGELDQKPSAQDQEAFFSLFATDYTGSIHSWVRETMFVAESDPRLADRIAADMAMTPESVGLPTFEGVFQWLRSRTPSAFLALDVPQYFINASGTAFDTAQNSRYDRQFEVRFVSDVGHFVMIEDSVSFNSHLREILRDLEIR